VVPSFSDIHLRLNLAGREVHGLVDPASYEAELDRWEHEFRRVRHPGTGAPLRLETTRPRRAEPLAWGGPVPDLIVRVADVVDRFEHPTVGCIGPVPYLRTGEHGGSGFISVPAGLIHPGLSDPGLSGPSDLGALLGVACAALVNRGR
jgi:hypothetical protein